MAVILNVSPEELLENAACRDPYVGWLFCAGRAAVCRGLAEELGEAVLAAFLFASERARSPNRRMHNAKTIMGAKVGFNQYMRTSPRWLLEDRLHSNCREIRPHARRPWFFSVN